MFENFYIQKQNYLYYTANANDTVIATITENEVYSKQFKNRFLKIVSSLFLNAPKRIIIESLRLDIFTSEGTILGYVMRGAGLKKDWTIYDASDTFVATIHANVKMSAPAISSFDHEGHTILHATSSYGASDFAVTTTDTLVASIKKRSLVYETIKENFFNYDVYHVHQNTNDDQQLLVLIAMTIAIDIDFFPGE